MCALHEILPSSLPEISNLSVFQKAKFGQNHYFCSTRQTVAIFAEDNIMPSVLKFKALQKRSEEFFSWVAKIWSFFFSQIFFLDFYDDP